jgi:hypothetical protein
MKQLLAAAEQSIELNGDAERVALGLLAAMAPLWGIVFPLIGLSTLVSVAGPILLLASFFCCVSIWTKVRNFS